MSASFSPFHGGRLTIDLAALSANWRSLAALCSSETGAVVKADAYGLGLDRVAPCLWQTGCRSFFVALPHEGARLRALLPLADIYVLGGFLAGGAALFIKEGLRPVLGDPAEMTAWLRETAGRGQAPALHIDTGLNRLGLSMEEARALAADRGLLEKLRPALVMSHFACADMEAHALTRLQLERFSVLHALFPNARASLANSAGVLAVPESHYDLTRPGIALYGGSALGFRENPMRPVVRLEAPVLRLRELAPGESVGYGATAIVTRPSRIAILALGYADGYCRAGFAQARFAAFKGRRLPLIGRVSMDLLAVDVTDAPEGIERGAWIELIGPHVPLDEMAESAGTIGYEILTRLGPRLARIYTE